MSVELASGSSPFPMLISEFSKATVCRWTPCASTSPRDCCGPTGGLNGGANPYQEFSETDLTAARMVKLQQSLGYSLALDRGAEQAVPPGARSPERTAAVLRRQIDRLDEKKAALDAALAFLRGKLAWVEAGRPGEGPAFDDYLC